MNNIILTRTQINNTNYIAYLELDSSRQIVNLMLYDDDNPSLLNNIYSARVDNIITNINSAFLKISPNQTCFMSLNAASSYIYSHKNSKKKQLCIGDEIIVQVAKDAVKTKDPVVVPKLSIYGEYSILTTENRSISVSHKINSELSEQIKDTLLHQYPDHESEGFGILVRTNAQDIPSKTLYTDVHALTETFTNIKIKASHCDLYSCLYKAPEEYLMALSSVDLSNIDQIITDEDDIYNKLISIERYKESGMISLYNDTQVSLSTLYSLKSQLGKLTDSRVWLKSGANIIIEQLETLTVVDVNTAKNQGRKTNALTVNLEAAAEILHQIKLRNISGMIIIDFINMKKQNEIEQLISFIKAHIKANDSKCDFIDITKLGLIELTRKKTTKSLKEQLHKN